MRSPRSRSRGGTAGCAATLATGPAGDPEEILKLARAARRLSAAGGATPRQPISQNGRSVEVDCDQLTGEAVKARDADAPKK
jgi:hypothetical protein